MNNYDAAKIIRCYLFLNLSTLAVWQELLLKIVKYHLVAAILLQTIIKINHDLTLESTINRQSYLP
jgi:hypothetical protein